MVIKLIKLTWEGAIRVMALANRSLSSTLSWSANFSNTDWTHDNQALWRENTDVTTQIRLIISHRNLSVLLALCMKNHPAGNSPHKGHLDSKVHGANMGPSGADRTQVGPMLAPWTLLSGQKWFSLKVSFLGTWTITLLRFRYDHTFTTELQCQRLFPWLLSALLACCETNHPVNGELTS